MPIGDVRLRGGATMPGVRPVGDQVFSAMNGVSVALQRLAADKNLDAKRLQEEETRAREQNENLAARARFSELQGSWSRSQVDYVNNAPIDGSGMTNSRYDQLRGERDAFIQTLPPRLQEEYLAITENTLQDFATNTYVKEYELRANYQTETLTKSAGDLAGRLRAGETTLEAAQAEFAELIETSSLPAPNKAALLEAAQGDLGMAAFLKITEDAMSTPQQVRDPNSGDVVLSGLLPGERGFLNAVAAKESAGKYNVRYSPSGGATFTDYSDHPRIFEATAEGDRSSAAGRYQITASTWDDLVNRYGRETLPDFSPASQDRAALLLARERYHMQRGSGMRSFDELMQDGSDEELLALKKILGGTGKNTTWKAFQTMDDADFIALFRGERGIAGGGTGSPQVPDVWTDPRFAGLDYDVKVKLAAEAQQAVNTMQATAMAQKKEFADLLRANVAAGSAGEAEVMDAINKGLVPSSDYDALLGLVKDERTARVAAQGYAQSVAAGLPLENSSDNQKAALTFMKQQGIFTGLQAMEPNASNQLSALFAAGGVLPPEVSGLLLQMAKSPDPRQVTYALDTLAGMKAKNPDVFASAVSKEALELEGVWSMARKYSPQGQANYALEMLRNFRDPAQAQARETLRKTARKDLEDISFSDIEQYFDPGMFSSQPSAPMLPQARGIFRADFEALYETYYPMFGDRDATTEFVAKQMQYNWGVDAVSGNNRLMYLGPTSAVSGYRPYAGSYDWIKQDILTTMGWEEGTEFELMSDGQTEADIRGQQPASYLLARKDENGLMRLELDAQGQPRRVRFTLNEELKQAQTRKIERANAEAKVRALEERDGVGPRFTLPGQLSQMFNRASPELEAARAALDEMNREWYKDRDVTLSPSTFQEDTNFSGEN